MTPLPPRHAVRRRGLPPIGPRLPDQRRGGRRWIPLLVALGGAAPFLLLAVIAGLGADAQPSAAGSPPAVEPEPGPSGSAASTSASAAPTLAEEAAEYAAGIREVALAAGQIIEFEMKPGVTDIRERAYDDEVLAGFSDRWASDFADLREGLAAVTPPEGLEASHQRYLDALDGYRETALLFTRAVQVPDGEREAALQQAIAKGEATDEVWDAGQDRLAAFLRDLGLDPGRWVPVTGDAAPEIGDENSPGG